MKKIIEIILAPFIRLFLLAVLFVQLALRAYFKWKHERAGGDWEKDIARVARREVRKKRKAIKKEGREPGLRDVFR